MKSLKNGPLSWGDEFVHFRGGESNSNHLFNGFNASFISCEPEVLWSPVAVVSAAPWDVMDTINLKKNGPHLGNDYNAYPFMGVPNFMT